MPPVRPKDLVDSVREGLVVLAPDLTVRFANRTFLQMFALGEDEVAGRNLGELAGRPFDTPELRSLLAGVIPDDSVVGPLHVEAESPRAGRRVIRLNARKVHGAEADSEQALVTFDDVTAEVDLERETERQQRLLQGVVDTVREGLLVLDGDLTVIAASPAFMRTFQVSERETIGQRLYDLGNRQWDIPALRDLLERIVPDHTAVEAFEVDHAFPGIGHRNMLLNARKIFREGNNTKTFLLAIEDVTERRRLEAEREAAMRRVEALLEELNHRVMNSLSIISSVIGMEGRAMSDEASRAAFNRIAGRVMAVASLYKTLSVAKSVDVVDAETFLATIGAEVLRSLQTAGTPLQLVTDIQPFSLASREAIAVGLVLNELLTNAIKYAFKGRDAGEIRLTANVRDGRVHLSVADNGSGVDDLARVDSGIGGKLIEVFSRQLGGETVRRSDAGGTVADLTFPLREAC